MEELKLIAAITHIKLYHLRKGDVLTMIEFEDGGGYKFNYASMYNRKPQYIDLTGKI